MPRMRRSRAVASIAGVFVAIVIGVFLMGMLVWRWFHGYYDAGDFVVKEAKWSPSRQLAVVAERPDNSALSGDQYFVLIGDHPFSKTELKLAYHSENTIFASDGSCLTLRWRDLHNLVVTCSHGFIEPSHIAVEKHQMGDVIVSYENIPEATPRN